MFERFGDFNSAEEINRTAKEQREAENEEAVLALARENGIDEEEARDYMDGCVDVLATPSMAAMGKLKIEAEDLELKGITGDWKDSIVEMCMEDDRLCAAVRSKKKSLARCMALLIRSAFENKVQISDKIVNITTVTHNGKKEAMRKPLYLGVPNRAEAKKIIRDYYLG